MDDREKREKMRGQTFLNLQILTNVEASLWTALITFDGVFISVFTYLSISEKSHYRLADIFYTLTIALASFSACLLMTNFWTRLEWLKRENQRLIGSIDNPDSYPKDDGRADGIKSGNLVIARHIVVFVLFFSQILCSTLAYIVTVLR